MAGIHKNLFEIHNIGKQTVEFLIHPHLCPAFSRYGIRLAGISHASREFRFVRPHPDMRQILICLRGHGEVLLNETWHPCTSGMAYVTPENQPHGYHSSRKWEVAWVTYNPPQQDQELPLPPIPQPSLIQVDPRPWEHILQGLYDETSHARQPLLLEYWAGLLHGHTQRVLTPKREAPLWQLWANVQKRLSHPWTLDELAQEAHMEKERLRRICLRETGTSPIHYVTHLRMQHALSLLANGQKVEASARTVGYEDAFAFSTAFKRIMGRPPSEFRA